MKLEFLLQKNRLIGPLLWVCGGSLSCFDFPTRILYANVKQGATVSELNPTYTLIGDIISFEDIENSREHNKLNSFSHTRLLFLLSYMYCHTFTSNKGQ